MRISFKLVLCVLAHAELTYLCMNEYKRNSDNKESLSKKGLALYINPMFFAIFFQYILNVLSMKDFHPKEP